MNRLDVINTDYYVISDDFRLLDFNQNVKNRYKGIQRGDLCYQATMKRDAPCPHCPIAGNSQNDCPMYYNPFYRDWVEAIFSKVDEGRYAVICHPANDDARSMFQRLKADELPIKGSLLKEYHSKDIGIIGGYCDEGFSLYYVNDRMIKMLGYDGREDFEEGISGKVVNIIHPDDLPQVTADLGKDKYYVGMKYEATYRMLRKDKTWFWTIDRGEVVETVDGSLAIISARLDVTQEHEQQEARKRESDASASKERIFADIIGALYGYNATVNLETGKYTLSVGTGMEEFIEQFSQTDDYVDACNLLLSNVLPEYIDEMNQKFSFEALHRQRNHRGHIGQMLYEGVTANGIGWFEVNVFMGVDDNGTPIASVFGRDVTEAHERADIQAQLEITKAASVAKSEFLFNMSHDIRTPMNAIIGFTALLKRHLDDKALAYSYIEKIETANDFLLSLINNVLEMARIESGKVILDETAGNMYEFWDSFSALFDTQMKEKEITFSRKIQVEHPNVMVDATKMREILLNILSNAVKYTPCGGKISLTVTEFPSNRSGYIVYQTIIEDTGIGMSDEFLPHIFEEFTRERTSTESKVVGFGLGMPIVKKLVDLMQGTIEVESELGKGTKFTLTLSHRIADVANTRIESEYCDEYTMEDFAGKRILLAEDNELNAEIAMTILGEEGFLVEHAEDGIICVDMIEKATSDYYDLVLMDIQMPNMDGYKATQTIRRLLDKHKAQIPIIAMTANAFEEDRKKAFRMGMNGHIAKPMQIETLKSTLSYVLSKKEEDKEIYQSWHEYFSECEPFNQFKAKYNKQGNMCGCLVYEAHDEEKILFADETLVHIFGCQNYMEFYKYVNGSFKNIVHPDDIERVEMEIANQIYDSDDSLDRVKYRIVRKDGEVRIIDDIGRRVFTENGSSVFYVFIVDVTDSMEKKTI